MDNRLKNLAEQLDAGLIARREFLRKAAVITGGTAAGLHALRGRWPPRKPKTKLRVWLFKSFVTAGNDVVAKQVEAWAKEKNVDVEMDWATFGDREQKFVAAIEAGNPPDMAEMNITGRCATRPALRDVSKLAGDRPRRKGGLLPFAERVMKVRRQVRRRRPLLDDHRVLHPQGHHGGQGRSRCPRSTIRTWSSLPRRPRTPPRICTDSARP